MIKPRYFYVQIIIFLLFNLGYVPAIPIAVFRSTGSIVRFPTDKTVPSEWVEAMIRKVTNLVLTILGWIGPPSDATGTRIQKARDWLTKNVYRKVRTIPKHLRQVGDVLLANPTDQVVPSGWVEATIRKKTNLVAIVAPTFRPSPCSVALGGGQ